MITLKFLEVKMHFFLESIFLLSCLAVLAGGLLYR